MMTLSVNLLSQFQELIYAQSSLWFSPLRMGVLKNQLCERIKERQIPSYEDYLKLLRTDLMEFHTLIDRITTKETYFFRLPDQFNALNKEIIPKIEEQLSAEALKLMSREKTGGGPWNIPLRIWSAGCATGEEAYSIAMTVLESLNFRRAWKVDILASDISREAVASASQGLYDFKALKKIPVPYQGKYLRILTEGAQVRNELTEKISFRIFNLQSLNPYYSSNNTFTNLEGRNEYLNLTERFDIIFCRNVMIYFDFSAQQKLVDNLYSCLKPGGYLFTGDAETLNIYRHNFKTREFGGVYFYQKPF